MQKIYEVVQNFWGLISNISKKAYRNCAVLMTGAAVIALISFNSKEFGGSGKNKTDILQPKNSGVLIKEGESGEEEQLQQTEEIVSVSMRDTEVFVREAGQMEYQKEDRKEKEQTIAKTENVETEAVKESAVAEAKAAEGRQTGISESVESQKIKVVNAVESKQPEMAESQELELSDAAREVMATDNLTVEAGTKKETESAETESETAEADAKEQEVTEPETAETANIQEENTTAITLDETNYQVLLRIVEAEASGEGIEGKKLVANVILNRVNHEEFPDSVEEVVFQKCGGHAQFSPTIDGRYESVTISEETIQAVEQVLNGEDSSEGALFFSARSKADPDNMSWFDNNLKWLFAYGGHEFYTLP